MMTKNNDGLLGKTPTNIPRHSASVAIEKTILSGKLSGLKSKLLLAYVGERQGNTANIFTVPSYVTSNLQIEYTFNKKTTLKASVKNIFDKRYVSSAFNEDTIRQGGRRSLSIGINYDF